MAAASRDNRRIARFTRTERALHWVHATGFLVLASSGLLLWLPALSTWVGRRNLVKNVHLWTALAWALALLAVVALGDRGVLRRSWREVETIDRDDRRWLTGRRVPQGRFNAGQKLNTLLTAAFALLLGLSGLFLWWGQRDHRFLLDGAGAVHTWLTAASLVLLGGHLYLAVIHPRTRHALRGITLGDVSVEWARTHHPKWVEADEVDERRTPSVAPMRHR
jgi:formate dehydrogenase subunit gamma